MNQTDRHKLQANYKQLTEVMYSSISPHLISSFILDLDMHAEIDACPTEKRKMDKLLQLLPSRGANALKELINALRPSYGWLASHLEVDITEPLNYDTIRNYCNNNLSGLTESSFENFKDFPVSSHLRSVEKILDSSSMVCVGWPKLANAMELSPSFIQDIRRNMSLEGGTWYAIHMILNGWTEKYGNSKATFSRLIQLVESEGFSIVSEKLIDLWSTLQ